MQRKILLVFASFLFYTHLLWAVPAVPWAIEKIQPDGTKISVFLKGDENIHWMESMDGYTLMYDAKKFIVYAQTDSIGNLVPSVIKFQNGIEPPSNITKGLRHSKNQINKSLLIEDTYSLQEKIQKASVGNVKILCVLASFSDRDFTKTKAEFEAVMNQIGYSANGAKGSVKDFYLENSYGALNLQATIVGPVKLSNTASYYASRTREFANEVVKLVDPLVDFSQFADDNKQVENFHIFFAGYGDEAIGNNQQIWSHRWTLSDVGNVKKDGVWLSQYSCSPELFGSSGTSITRIGVIAHELGHILGSPDYYDVHTSDGIDFYGSGNWDLMGSGSWNNFGHQPASVNPYQKIKFGWLTPQFLVPGSSILNMPPSAKNPVIYKIMVNSNGEHYLLENKQYIGFDASIPGHGLLVWHIAANVASYAPNNKHPLQVYPICASSSTPIPYDNPMSYGNINSAGCPFPGTSGKTEFTNTSTPRAFSWDDSGWQNGLLKNITENANKTISFDAFCLPMNFHDKTISQNTILNVCDINIKNVSVKDNSNLTIYFSDGVTINNDFEIAAGSELIITNQEPCTICPITVSSWPTSACRGKEFQLSVINAISYEIHIYSLTGALIYQNSSLITNSPMTVWRVPQTLSVGYYNMEITLSSGEETISKSYNILVSGC